MDKPELKKLSESIPTSIMKIIDLYNKIDNDLLDTQPNYQRKLVWKKQHKYAFIDTILLNFPFPEIYIASSDIDVENMVSKEVVVDGQQRLTTIVEYIKGEGDFAKQNKVPYFNDLSSPEKKEFLNYKVSVKDLKDIDENIIKEIFQRINSTEYSLNIVEKNNAQFGDGEIAIFCKQLVDNDYTPTEDETDIIISKEDKEKINNFFDENKVFTDNDKKRMYDFQYLMLIMSTILEGEYFSRSTKVDEYLETYNSSFPDYQKIIDLLISSIDTITSLGFSSKSYWFNKANLFTLLVELPKAQAKNLNLELLEYELLQLEEKVDLYFNAETEEEIQDINEDERKYFEVARHGSHEKGAREHRGKVINKIIQNSISIQDNNVETLEKKNIKFLKEKGVSFATLIPTKTGLNKSIMDAVTNVREFLKNNEIHNYYTQDLGPDHKEKLKCFFDFVNEKKETEMSLYRSNGRGDFRIWIKELNDFANPNDKLALIVSDDVVNILNLTSIDYS